MSSCSIVEHLNVVEYIGLGEVSRFVDSLVDTFLFQTTEEGLSDGVVTAVSASAHAGFELVCFVKV